MTFLKAMKRLALCGVIISASAYASQQPGEPLEWVMGCAIAYIILAFLVDEVENA